LAFMNELDGKPTAPPPVPGTTATSDNTPSAVVTLANSISGPGISGASTIEMDRITTCKPVFTGVTNVNTMPPSSSDYVITTISSRVVPKSELEAAEG